jgi:hypothetical protein
MSREQRGAGELQFYARLCNGYLDTGYIKRKPEVLHCKKRLSIFPSPAEMSLTKLSMAGNY